MIQLGTCDATVSDGARDAYLTLVKTVTRVDLKDVRDGIDKLAFGAHAPTAQQNMSVSAIQQALKDIGFFPGGQADGICGYRTLSAIRLFQEYVRTVEKQPSTPDGVVGPTTQAHIQRWIDNGQRPEWAPTIEQWKTGTLGTSQYTRWLALLSKVKAKYAASPNRMLQLVNAYTRATDTKKVAEWDFDPKYMHLVGIRRTEARGKFDDVFVFLIKGLAFKFQGSTEPGSTESERGTPFLVQGQHDYHFGWHQRRYLALRPEHLGTGKGVLVVRSKDNDQLDDRDLDNGLEPNYTINIHWGGKGTTFNVNNWSAGCQVINGTMYLNHKDDLIDCSAFVARNNKEVANTPGKTRGAYNVLVDLATALSSDMGSNTVKYTLLAAEDLGLDPTLKQELADARARAGTLLR